VSTGEGEFVPMNAASDLETADRYVATLEKAEAQRHGIRVVEARPLVARGLQASAGTLEGIRKRRTKVIPSWLMARIRARFIAHLQSEITRLEHEISLAHQTGAHHTDHDLQAAQAQVVAAREILSRS